MNVTVLAPGRHRQLSCDVCPVLALPRRPAALGARAADVGGEIVPAGGARVIPGPLAPAAPRPEPPQRERRGDGGGHPQRNADRGDRSVAYGLLVNLEHDRPKAGRRRPNEAATVRQVPPGFVALPHVVLPLGVAGPGVVAR